MKSILTLSFGLGTATNSADGMVSNSIAFLSCSNIFGSGDRGDKAIFMLLLLTNDAVDDELELVCVDDFLCNDKFKPGRLVKDILLTLKNEPYRLR
jgi:hypothetical protein